MSFPSAVEKLRSLVLDQIEAGGYPFPAELPLSLIRWESAGDIGAVNKKSGASGLMQVMEITLQDFNRHTGNRYTMADLRGKTKESAKKQIKVGLWVLGYYWRLAYRFIREREPTVPVDDLVTIADMFYAAGPGRIKPKFKKLPNVRFSQFAKAFPTHKATLHAAKVWGLAEQNNPQWNVAAIDNFVSGGNGSDGGDGGIDVKPAREGFLLALLLIAVVWFFFQKKEAENVKV